MKNQRLKHFVASLLVVLSLFASLVSACACAHHQQQTETVSSSCHEHSPGAEAETHQRADSSETAGKLISETECCCASPVPRVFAKAENVKIEKQISVSA